MRANEALNRIRFASVSLFFAFSMAMAYIGMSLSKIQLKQRLNYGGWDAHQR